MKTMEERSRALLSAVGSAERAITFCAFLVLIAVLFGDVVSRELTGAGIIWARQVGVYANLFLTLVGIGVASAEGAHLRPRFADRWLPAAWDPALERLREVLMAAFCVAFAFLAALAVAETRALGERTAMPAWLVWPFESVIPVVFLVAGLRHGLYACWPALSPAPAGEAAGIGTDAADVAGGANGAAPPP